MFIDNKYKKWHDSIIDRAKNRVLSFYTEKHHIIPKSCGGSDDKSNLVKLTAKEHFIVHMLLCKCTEGKYKYKMLYAFDAMRNIKKENRDYKVNSRISVSLKNKLRSSDHYKNAVRLANIGNKNHFGKKHSEETKLKISKNRKGKGFHNRKCKEETKIKLRKANKNKKHTKEAIEKIRQAGIGRVFSLETRKKISEKRKLYWKNRRAA